MATLAIALSPHVVVNFTKIPKMGAQLFIQEGEIYLRIAGTNFI